MTATTLDGVLLKGVAASRPAASAVAKGTLYSATDTGAITQSDGVSTWSAYATIGATATRASLGLDTTDSPQFAGLNVGAATDTTITRTGAGDVAVEGNALYRAGGTDVPIADGGTGQSTKAAAFDALQPMTTSGDVIYGGASGTGTRLAKGADGTVLTLASGLPSWAAVTGTGTVTTVKDEGSNLSTAVVSIDFVGAGVTATGTTAVTVTIPGATAADPIADVFGTPDTAFEFGTSSLAGLTAIGTPTVIDANTTVPGCLYIKDSTTTTAFMGEYLASPATPFTAITKVQDSTLRANYNTAALLIGVANPATGAFVTCSWQSNSGRATKADGVIAAEKMTNRTTYSSDMATDYLVGSQRSMYLAMVCNSTTSIDYYWSFNGSTWKKFGSAVNPSLTVASVGLAMRSESAAGCAVAFDFLRIWNSAKTFPSI